MPKPREVRKAIVTGAVVLLVLLIAFWPSFESTAALMDEGIILLYPEMIQHGKLPYRDFETFYGPANPVLLATAFSIFGTNIFVERSVGLLYRILVLLAIFVIVHSWERILSVGCMVLSGCLLLGTRLPAYAWFGAMGLALWSLWLSSRSESNTRCFFAGLLASGALLFRPDVGPALIISVLPLFYGMRWSQRWKYVFGVGIGLLPLGILTFIIGLHPVVNNLFLLPVFQTSQGRHLPLFSVEASLIALFFAHLVAALVNVVAGFVAIRANGADSRGRLLLAVALFGLGLSHQAAQRLDLDHLLFTAFISLGILPLSLVILTSHFRKLAPRKSEMLLAIGAVLVILSTIEPRLSIVVRSAVTAAFDSSPSATFAEHNGRSFPFGSPKVAQMIGKMLVDLDGRSKAGERLFVGPADLRRTNYNDACVYHMMPKLTPATYFLEMNPRSANAPGSRLATDIQSADWLLLNRAWDNWDEPNRSVDFGSDAPNEVVRTQFDLCGEYGSFLLFRRKSSALPAS